MKTKTLTVMFVDLVGSTTRASMTTRERFIAALSTYKSLILPVFDKYGGWVVKEIGDGYMVAFESPTNAVLCGIDLQNSILMHNRRASRSDKLHVRVAINTGEVQVVDNDIYGEAVNIASRLEKITPPNRIFFTESVFLSMNKNEAAIGFTGGKKLKDVPHRIRIYTVLGKYDRIMRKIRRRKRKAVRRRRRSLVTFFLLIVLLILLGAAYMLLQNYSIIP